MQSGYYFVIAAHAMWGFFPLYWRLLDDIPPAVLACHRIVWSFLLMLVVIPAIGKSRQVITATLDRKIITTYAIAAILIALNWFSFLYAVSSNRVLEASLGYYISPLFNVLLGVVVLNERLSRPQLMAIVVATIGVIIMASSNHGFPWVSLLMASSFAFYGLTKKRAPLNPIVGMCLETGVLFIPALLWIGIGANGLQQNFGQGTLKVWLLLMGGGVVTTLPLILFATAAQRVSLSTIGILQYIGPTLQFLIAAFVFKESLELPRLIGFAFVWTAVLLYIYYIAYAAPRQARRIPAA